MRKLVALCFSLAILMFGGMHVSADPKSAIVMLGSPALPADFKNLPYANPLALQGGVLKQAVTGSFDSVNPFIIKGNAAAGSRTLVFESLMGRNGAEPFALYGLLAETIDVSVDRQIFTFKLRPEAKFSDGTSVTASDVVFSMETLRDKGRPNYKNNYMKISKTETPDDRTVIFHQEKGDRELPMIVALMPILSKKSWDGRIFDESSLAPIIGSGPYIFGDIKPGESVSYKKNPDYWGKNLAINQGHWNFDTFRFDYYRDANAAFEAFKKGDADFRIETDPVRWNTGYKFPAVNDGKVVLEKIEQKTPASTSGFAFNTRRKLFEDPKVREALVMAFDFEWANANLFGNAYTRTYGYYSGSELSSQGKAPDAAELAILANAPLRADMRDGTYALPVSDGSGRDRKLLRKAVDLLVSAGWQVAAAGLMNAKGENFTFTISIQNPDQEKIALHYQRTLQQIGIKADIRMVDAAQFTILQKTYDYDMIPVTWFNSLSPGNEQTLYFGSYGRTSEGTRNYPGIADPAVDHAIEAMLKASTKEEFVAAVRAEDRLLVSGFYIIPFYDAGGQWVARWSYIGKPERQPLTGFESVTLWHNP